MSIRVVNGNTSTEDGWPLVDQDGCTWIHVPACDPPVSIQVQSGIPAAVLGAAWVADLNAFVQKVRDADSASWTASNSVLGQPGRNNGSNHLGGTAVDVDWDDHPMGPEYAGWSAEQIAEIRRMREFYKLPDGTYLVFWAEDWDVPHDSMHFQMGYGTFERQDAIRAWMAKNIRADGFSTYRRGNAPMQPPAAQVLADATGLTVDRAGVILPTVISGLKAAQCNNVNRIAMWLAQCGEESAGFSTTTEFASGAEYEGRCSDLGNCSPGDGVKYKGRTWIQITGKAHYAEFSQWAFGHGLCSSATQFVDNPVSLGDLPWAGIGAAWYWTVSRPDINALSDAGDVVTVTKRINGGTNGLADRQNRYNRAHALGDQLLALTTSATNSGDDDLNADESRMLKELYDEYKANRHAPSRSFFAKDQQWGETPLGFEWNIDGNVNELYMTMGYLLNVPSIVADVEYVAANGVAPASWAGSLVDGNGSRWLAEVGQQWCSNLVEFRTALRRGLLSQSASVAVQDQPVQPQIVYRDAPAPAPVAAAPSGSTGQLIGNAYDAARALLASPDMDETEKSAAAALISVLQTKAGAKA